MFETRTMCGLCLQCDPHRATEFSAYVGRIDRSATNTDASRIHIEGRFAIRPTTEATHPITGFFHDAGDFPRFPITTRSRGRSFLP